MSNCIKVSSLSYYILDHGAVGRRAKLRLASLRRVPAQELREGLELYAVYK